MIDRLRSIRPPGIRIQLMLWSTTIFALLLFAFSVIFYLTLEDALNADIDADLQLRIRQIAVGITNDNGTTSNESVRLDQLVSDVVATLQALAVERSITLQLRKVQPATVQGDPSRLAQCIINLVDNALTYTPIGGVVTIRVEVKGHSGCITIQYTGIGIAPQHLPHIFERFYRADPARSQREGKSGLGLSLVEWIVHAHGGSIEVESQEGCGSTFSVTLPLVKCS